MREIWNELTLIYMQFNNKTGYRNRKNLIKLIHQDELVQNKQKISKVKSSSSLNINFEHLNGCSYERGRDTGSKNFSIQTFVARRLFHF